MTMDQVTKTVEEMAQVINEYGRTYDDGVKGCEDHLARFLYNAGYRKERQGEWISVEDRLPQNDYQKSEKERKKYLVYTEPRGIMYEATFGYEEHDWWVTKESVFDRVLSLDFSEYVTHWQPLPTPPKMKGAE